MIEETLFIGWTTLEKHADAECLAKGFIEKRLAVCVQIEGPVNAVYHWQGRVETATEYRLMIKFLASLSEPLEEYLLTQHPYTTPQWVVVETQHVSKAYLEWACQTK